MPETTILPGHWIPDAERAAFGLGWEYARRGLQLDANPFKGHPWKEDAFADGFRKFVPPKGGIFVR